MASFHVRWRALIVSVAVFGAGAAVHGAFHVLTPPGARPLPSVAAVPWLLACFGLGALVVSAIGTVRRARGGLARLGAVTLHVMLAMAGAAGVLACDPAFPFGPTYEQSLALPGDRGTAYLYRGGLFCDQRVWLSSPGAWWAHPDPATGRYTCARAGHLEWDATEAVLRVVDSDGRPVPAPAGWDGVADGLDWRPH